MDELRERCTLPPLHDLRRVHLGGNAGFQVVIQGDPVRDPDVLSLGQVCRSWSPLLTYKSRLYRRYGEGSTRKETSCASE